MKRSTTTSFAALAASLAAGLALAAPLPAMAGVGGFRLPTPSPTPTPDVVGPVVPELPQSRPTRPVPQPTPTPRPTIVPAPAPSPTARRPSRPAGTVQPVPRQTQSPLARPTQPSSPAPQTGGAPAPVGTVEAPGADPTPAPDGLEFGPDVLPTETAGREAQSGSVASDDSESGSNLLWWLLGIVVLALSGMAVWFVRKRGLPTGQALVVPQIEKPRPRQLPTPADVAASEPEPAPPSTPAPASEPAAPAGPPISAESGTLGLAMTSRRLSLSMMAATLDYELILVNSGTEPIRGLEIQGDMIGAHASLPSDQQVAYAAQPLEKRHDLDELPAGESRLIKGQIRLPFSAVRAVAQGRAPLLVPLSRWRVTTQDPQLEPLVQTFLVGQQSDRRQQGIQPFRLDKGPGVFSSLVQRSFA